MAKPENIIIYQNLSHVVFTPSKKSEDFQLLHRKGEPIIKKHLFLPDRKTRKTYKEDLYGWKFCYDYDAPYTREEVIKELGIPKELIDIDGTVWEAPYVTVHFLDGTTKTKRFIYESDAMDYFNVFREHCHNELK